MTTQQSLIESLPAEPGMPGRDLILGTHRLAESELFSDAGLARLIDRHPAEDLHIHTMGEDAGRYDWRRGERDGLSAEELLRAVRDGRLWIIALRIFRHNPEFRALTEVIYAELRARIPGFRPFNLLSNVLISSPGAQVFYHADAAPSILWHVRGRKRFFLYPTRDEAFISREHLEAIFAGRRGEDVPFRPEFDEAAQVFDLDPGRFIAWPQAATHRIRNLEGLNVSLATEFWTRETNLRQAIYNANVYFREKFGIDFRDTRIEGPAALVKANTFRVLRRVAPIRHARPSMQKTFRVDPNAPDGFVDSTH
jgi:hypothetical protein